MFRYYLDFCFYVCELREFQRGGFYLRNLFIWGLELDFGFSYFYMYYLNMSK